MFVGFLVAMAVASQLDQFREMFADNTEPIGLLLAAAVMFVVGAIDDIREVSPPAKIAGQVLSGSVLSLLGVTMLYFRVPFASYEYVVLSPDLAPLVTVIGVVLLANAINLIDGLDGLAAGIVLIAAAAMFLYADRLFKAGLLEGSNMAPLVAAITVGCARASSRTTSTRRASSWATPARCSSGLLMATMTITVGGRTADPFSGQTYFYFAPLAIPLVILGVPIFDTAFSFLRRVVKPPVVRAGRPRAPAPPAHAHGPRPRRAVVILWLWTALLSAVVLLPTFTNRGNSLVPLAVVALGLLLYIYFHPGVTSVRAGDAGDGPTPRTPGDVVKLEPRRAGRREKAARKARSSAGSELHRRACPIACE